MSIWLRLRLDSWARWLRGSRSCAGCAEALVKSFEGDGSSAFSFGTSATGCTSLKGAIAMPGHVGVGEGRADAHGDEDVEDLVGYSGDERLHGAGEEFGKCKGLTGVAAERCGLGGIQVREDFLVEAEVCPAGEEAKCSLPESGSGE